MALNTLFARYDRLLIFDTETSGLDFEHDQIIEFAAVAVDLVDGVPTVALEYDQLVSLNPGNSISLEIQQLTGISNQDVGERGIEEKILCEHIAQMLTPNTLLIAYNAHFDLSFLFYTLARSGNVLALKGKDKLDLLTVFKDRREYPHKLANAITAYGLGDKVVNSHRAIDDVLATLEVMKAMDDEAQDLLEYINLFGYNPKYGVSGKRIGSITYRAQPYNSCVPLYERRR